MLGRSLFSTAKPASRPSRRTAAGARACSRRWRRDRARSVCPLIVGSTTAMAGRSMPGSVFSTKREIAISAPVLPALTQACASPSLTRLMRDAHRRILFAAQRERRRLVHADHLACGVNRNRGCAQPSGRAILSRLRPAARPGRSRFRDYAGENRRRGHRHMGAMIATHAIDGDGNVQFRTPSRHGIG